MITIFRRLLILAALAAVSLHAQTQVTFTLSGTVNGAAAGYLDTDPLTFSFVLNTPTAPTGDFNSPYISWIRDGSSPALFSSVSATGMTGTWDGTDSTGALLDDEIIINTSFNSLTLQTYANTGNLRLSAPDGHAVDYIYLQAAWTGLSLPSTGIADPLAYFAARAGTYSFSPGTSNIIIDVQGDPSVHFLPSSLTISTAAIPEPATTASFAGLSCFSLVLFLRRRRQ